ncbi:2-oxo-4-hydroxy-4-carboxy-5-ureidoimidazoline decarboxylase [Dankookia sp. P2]|uniref:2-oxo-4-hydroxy-4-carboxy-5-ureidoimidazoline decarboxylase n=1 Tax=Dankookia sp. P2 TaxID=3423955 RepID=UPI003D67BC40
MDAAARARFLALNEAYRTRFGIPFIMAVRDRSAAEILAGFEARLGNTPEQERAEAVRQIGRILLLRLQDRSRGLKRKQGWGGKKVFPPQAPPFPFVRRLSPRCERQTQRNR